jgi:hypothetical protein
MTLTIGQYAEQFEQIDAVVAGAVELSPDGSELILYDPDPSAVTGGVRDRLGTWSILDTPPDPAAHASLRKYAAALTQQLVGAARVSREDRIAASAPGAPGLTPQTVDRSLATVRTTHINEPLATRMYTVSSPYLPAGAPESQRVLLSGFAPGAEVAGVIEGVRAVLDTATTTIDAMVAAV